MSASVQFHRASSTASSDGQTQAAGHADSAFLAQAARTPAGTSAASRPASPAERLNDAPSGRTGSPVPVAAVVQRVTALQHAYEQAIGRQAELKGQISAVDQQLAAMKPQDIALQTRQHRLDAEQAQLHRHRQSIQHKAAELMQRCANEQKARSTLDATLAQAKRKGDEINSRVTDLKKRRTAVEHSLGQAAAIRQTAQQWLADANRLIATTNDDQRPATT